MGCNAQMGPYVLEIQEMEKKIKDLESEVIQAVGKCFLSVPSFE